MESMRQDYVINHEVLRAASAVSKQSNQEMMEKMLIKRLQLSTTMPQAQHAHYEVSLKDPQSTSRAKSLLCHFKSQPTGP